ncbi:MAG: squalene synthase HpnC [Planctomycetota bacterium]
MRSRKLCRRLARSHYENFLVASVLLPRRMRQPFYDLYAFCRVADDVADESPDPKTAIAGLDQMAAQLDAVFGRSTTPTTAQTIVEGQTLVEGLFIALQDTVQQFRLTRQPFDDLLAAFRQDQHVHRYESMDRLLGYCRGSANPVGRLVLQLADCRQPAQLELSDKICTALQLVNFWQDVARDRLIGRVYLPQDAMEEHRVTESMLDRDATSPQLKSLLRSLCDQTETMFHEGMALSQLVPAWLARDVKLFAHGGLQTIQAIRRIDCDVLRVRPRVSKGTQLGLVANALLGRL